MYELESQVVWTAVSIFFGFLFPMIVAMWIFWKAISGLLAKMNESLAETNKTLCELKTDWAKSFAEVRGDIKTLNTCMDGLDKRMDDFDSHMNKRMDGLGGQVCGLRGEIRGINEFLRRDSVKDTEDDKES